MDRKRKASSELENDREQPPPAKNMPLAPDMDPEQSSSFPSEGSTPSSESSARTDGTQKNHYALEFQRDFCRPEQYADYLRTYALSVSANRGYLPSSPNLCALNSAQPTLSRFVFDRWEDQPNLYMPVPEGFGPSGPVIDTQLGVGFCMGRFPKGEAAAYMDLIVINNAYRGQGHGRRLHRELFKRCLRNDRHHVVAIMKKSDLNSQAFHRALGFWEGSLSYRLGYDNDVTVCMWKILPAAYKEPDHELYKRFFPNPDLMVDDATAHLNDPAPDWFIHQRLQQQRANLDTYL